MRPLLSVIIPAYNCKDLLDDSAGSVLSQLPDNCELIIVDDGSSDGTAEKLKELEGRQENLFICYEEHRGASGARNKYNEYNEDFDNVITMEEPRLVIK
jgi:glycosyltransferase involved in cell wall biosynthesis